MTTLFADLPIRVKFLLLPALAALLLAALGALYVTEQRATIELQQRLDTHDVPRMRELSRQFSQLSTTHVQFVSLLASSFRSGAKEGGFYQAGREKIVAVNQTLDELRALTAQFDAGSKAGAIGTALRQRVVEYRNQMGEAVLISSVDLELIARMTLSANQAYDAANREFLALNDEVQEGIGRESRRLLERVQTARARFFVALCATILLIGVASWLLSRRFAADVASLMSALQRLSSGDTSAAPQPPRERRDEFGAVATTVRAFRQALQQRDQAQKALEAEVAERKRIGEDLRELNAQLEQRVEQRTAQLAASRDEAERANQAKSEFLSRMSHELRTPMNAILGFGQLLEADPELRGSRRDWVHEIVAGGRHLLDLINDVLDLARVESGRFTVSPEPVALRPLIEECLTLLRPLAEAGGVRLLEASRHCDVQVRADRTRLKQVLLNLLANAVKYNRRGGSVNVVCVADGGTALRVRVSDTGPGLTPEQTARLFVPFERLEADLRQIEGTGIGLALSKRLLEAMDGSIGVESTPGAGSTFWFRVPLAAAAAPPVIALRDGEHTAAPTPEPVAPPLDVLCIEDNPANLRLIEGIFARRRDIRLLSALAPGLGLELARTHRPALVLLDINLPDMDGYAVMQCLRENEETRQVPVVAISANAMPRDIERGKAAGFVGYITKPIDVAELLRVVDAQLAKHLNRRALGPAGA